MPDAVSSENNKKEVSCRFYPLPEKVSQQQYPKGRRVNKGCEEVCQDFGAV